MGANISAWSTEALGYSLTKEEFLLDHDAQDLIGHYKVHQYSRHYRDQDVISLWFTGQPLKGNEWKQDINGTSNGGYVKQVLALLP